MLDVSYLVEVTHSVIFPLLGQVDELATPDAVTGPLMRGSVGITGEARVVVSVDCSEALARRLSAAMFDTEAEALSEEEVKDALGEVTNIIGGNIKALLPGPAALGLPMVGDVIDASPCDAMVQQVFHCAGEPLRVSLVNAEPD